MVAARPDVFNHNLETVPSKYLTVRPGARYFASIRLLQRVKELDPLLFTKSGIMVGLGEERNEVLQVMDDLRAADVDFLTIGQYLQPSRKHHPVMRFVPPEEFKALATIAYAKGFLMVSASPLTRSSHHAGEDFARLRALRARRLIDAAIFHHAAGAPLRLRHVRPCRRRRALSGIRAAVPIARRAQAHERREGREVIVADMTVAYKLMRETFTSRVTLDRPKLEILVEYLEGPFRRHEQSLELPRRSRPPCDVEFFIAYEFRSRTLGLLMGAVFDAAFRRFAAAFERRADEVYGAQAGLGRRGPRLADLSRYLRSAPR